MKDTSSVLVLMLEQIKQILEKMHQGRTRNLSGESSQTKGNGYNVQDLQFPFGRLEGLRMPRSHDGGFKSELLPHCCHNLEEIQELVRALILAGVFARKIGEVSSCCMGCRYRLLRLLDWFKPIRAYVYSTNALERVNKEIKRRLKSMEQFQNETSAEKYLYVILSELNDGPYKKRLKNWKYYYNLYQEKKKLNTVHRRIQPQLKMTVV